MTTQLTKHLGDCTIYRSLVNQSPEDGICTCGYGWSLVRKDADWSQMYSAERTAEMERIDDEEESDDAKVPVAWLVYCPVGHERDYRVFTDESRAGDVANDFADQEGVDEWAVYPLVVGQDKTE